MTESYAYGMWPAVVINVGIFLFFALSYLKPKKRREWRAMGAFSAFVVALFTERRGKWKVISAINMQPTGSRCPCSYHGWQQHRGQQIYQADWRKNNGRHCH